MAVKNRLTESTTSISDKVAERQIFWRDYILKISDPLSDGILRPEAQLPVTRAESRQAGASLKAWRKTSAGLVFFP